MKYWLMASALVVGLAGCSKHDPLHDSMEEMGGSFKAMRESQNDEAMLNEWQNFKTALATAKAQKVTAEDQPKFDEGMQKLEELSAQVDVALAAGDMAGAKALLKKMGPARKEYHDALGVD
ncbi:cytochrome b562 [Gilvimarinus chinensis]|uniref:cytochrome b562 n=1 Tax=Gilvimarinus chinensis TaxID=396005 RepID=UPI00035DE4C9|nr:cytochrome b562 [Gilvimarinus chinensis]